MTINLEKFKKFREDQSTPDQVLLATPIEDQRMVAAPRNRNPVIKDEMTEILNMKEGGWDSLTPEQKEAYRRQMGVYQR